MIGAVKHTLIIFFEYNLLWSFKLSPVVLIICLPYLMSLICFLNF